MRSSGGKSALSSKRVSREDAAYEQRRWDQILEDLSHRPNLERAQAEAIGRKVLAVEGSNDERRREIEQRITARFGPSPLAIVPSAPSPSEVPVLSAGLKHRLKRISSLPAPHRKPTQGVLSPEWLEPSAPLPQSPLSKPISRRAHASVTTETGIERQFRDLVLRIGLDAAHGVIADLERFAVE